MLYLFAEYFVNIFMKVNIKTEFLLNVSFALIKIPYYTISLNPSVESFLCHCMLNWPSKGMKTPFLYLATNFCVMFCSIFVLSFSPLFVIWSTRGYLWLRHGWLMVFSFFALCGGRTVSSALLSPNIFAKHFILLLMGTP